jgi:hypothetical protein
MFQLTKNLKNPRGLVIGLIIVIVILVILNQLKILNLTNLFSAKVGTEKSGSVINAQLSEKAKKAGWEIAWQGDTKDTTGRTIMAKGKRSEELLEDKFYWTRVDNVELKLVGFSQGMGTFDRWEKINNSKDQYLILKNPLTKSSWKEDEQLGVRVIFENSKTGTESTDFKITQVVIENLDYGFKNKTASSSLLYGYFKDLDQQTIDKLIKPGDIVAVYPVFLDIETAKREKSLMQLDKNKTPIAQTVLIRRFGGRDTLQTNF